MFSNTFENPIFLISYGTRNVGIRISSGTHLYSNFPFLCLPYVLLSFIIRTPGIELLIRMVECTMFTFLEDVSSSTSVNISFANNLCSIGLIGNSTSWKSVAL